MGLDGDLQKLEESGDFFADGRIGPVYTGTIRLDRDEKLHPPMVDTDDADEASEPATVLAGDDVVVHVSMTAWMRSAFVSKVAASATGPDSESKMVDVDEDEADDPDGKVLVLYSFDEIYASLARYLHKKFYTTAQVRVVFLAADKGVMREKQLTAQKRATHGLDPYPESVQLTGNGIRQSDDGPESKVHIHRLMRTSRMRGPLYAKMMERCLADKSMHLRTILWDVDKGPPVQMFRGQATRRPDLEWPKVLEDDILMPLHAFPGAQNIFCARDRDMKCIALLHRERMPKRCILDFGDGRHIPVHEFAARLKKAGWTIDMYVCLGILCGNDTFFKKWVANGFCAEWLAAGCRALLAIGRRDLLDKRDFVLLLRLVYSYKAGRKDGVSTQDDLRDTFAGYKRINFPEEDLLHRAYLRFKWSFDYWNSLHGTLFRLDPIPDGSDITDA